MPGSVRRDGTTCHPCRPMEATLLWLIERKALTLTGFVVVLLGAFIPWPTAVIAIVVVILGALLMLAQIPFAMRAAQKVPSPQRQFPEIPSIPPAYRSSTPVAPAQPPSTAVASAHEPSEAVASAQAPAGQLEAQRGD